MCKIYSLIAVFAVVLFSCAAEPRVNSETDVQQAKNIVEMFYVKIKSGQQQELALQFNGRMSSKEALKEISTDTILGPYVSHEVVSITTNVTTVDGINVGSYSVMVLGRYENGNAQERITIMLDSAGYHFDRYTRIPKGE